MPSFTLYDLNPDFWARVQAKAKAEGVTVKAVILKLLTQWLGVLALALLTVACTTPYEPTPLPKNPVVTAPTPPPTTAPTVSPLAVTLTVGRPSPDAGQSVQFWVSNLPAITSAQWSFGNGATQTTSSTETAYAYPAPGTYQARVTITATDGRTGSDTQTVTVSRRQTPPAPAPTPTSPTPTPALAVALTCTEKPALSATPCNVNLTYGGSAMPVTNLTDVIWNWGDGLMETTTGPVRTHVYASPGTYTVYATVRANTIDGDRSAVTSQTLTIP